MPSEEGGARTDRQVSRLISLGGAALIVGQAIPMVQEARDFAWWWNAAGVVLMLQILVFAALGGVLPRRALRAAWVAAPVVNAALLFSAYAAHTGPLPTNTLPWPWAFEAAVVSYLVLTVPPRVAAACTVGSALLPLLSAAVFLGEIPPAVLVDTPIHAANVIYIALFSGIRGRLNRLREARGPSPGGGSGARPRGGLGERQGAGGQADPRRGALGAGGGGTLPGRPAGGIAGRRGHRPEALSPPRRRPGPRVAEHRACRRPARGRVGGWARLNQRGGSTRPVGTAGLSRLLP